MRETYDLSISRTKDSLVFAEKREVLTNILDKSYIGTVVKYNMNSEYDRPPQPQASPLDGSTTKSWPNSGLRETVTWKV